MGNLCLRKKERSQQPQYNIADENHITYTPASLDELEKKIKIESQEALILNIENKQDQFLQENNQNTIQILNDLDKDALIKQGQLAKEELSKMKQQQYDDAVLYFGKQSLKENLTLPIKSEQNDEQIVQIELERIGVQQDAQQQRDQQQENQKFGQEQEAEKLRLQKFEEERIKQEQENEQIEIFQSEEQIFTQKQIQNQIQDQIYNSQFKFVWSQGGSKVFLTGSWLNWIDKIELLSNDNRFEIELKLPIGNHQFKFIVDDEWKVSDQYEYNGQNNLIKV